ncbi:MAG: type II toxin-antitoxin system RelE/ParE family toxin [Spirochaetaceae bacterium]|jgi:toxin ParE1/3/4|nr:type II toxin-antitoxin system RelE/ParE family toxin [Spirochaetaceae bacterium]
MAEKLKEYSVAVTRTAEDDLDDIISYIANDNVPIALKILDKLQKAINSLKQFPERGRRVPELLDKNIKEYRELIEAPWRIIYKIENNDVNIITVIDGRRNVQDILTKKLIK